MITEPLPKSYDPKPMVYEIGCKNQPLYTYLKQLFSIEGIVDPGCIKEYFDHEQINYKIFTRMRASTAYFSDDDRKNYFARALDMYTKAEQRTLIYIDPDVGSDISLKRRYRSNRQMYVKAEELKLFKEQLMPEDSLVYFQHLGNSQYNLDQRLSGLKEMFGQWVLIAGYQRIQGCLIFIFNNEDDYKIKWRMICKYFKRYENLKHSDKIILQ